MTVIRWIRSQLAHVRSLDRKRRKTKAEKVGKVKVLAVPKANKERKLLKLPEPKDSLCQCLLRPRELLPSLQGAGRLYLHPKEVKEVWRGIKMMGAKKMEQPGNPLLTIITAVSHPCLGKKRQTRELLLQLSQMQVETSNNFDFSSLNIHLRDK